MKNRSKSRLNFLETRMNSGEGKSKFNDKHIATFTPEISKDNQTKIRPGIKETVRRRNNHQTIEQIADNLNSKLRGWLNNRFFLLCHRLKSESLNVGVIFLHPGFVHIG